MIHRVTVLDNGSLRISNVTKMDDGVYTCVARNQFGVASSAGSLLVKGKLYLMKRLFWFLRVCFSLVSQLKMFIIKKVGVNNRIHGRYLTEL